MDLENSLLSTPFYKTKKGLLITGSAVAVMLLGGAMYYLTSHTPTLVATKPVTHSTTGNTHPTLTSTPAQTIAKTVTPTAVITPTPLPGGQEFYSTDLGIAFSYASTAAQKFAVKEIGDTAYLYDPTQVFTKGAQYVEVLSKDPHDTLQQAITKAVLKGYLSSDCPIGAASLPEKYYPSTYSTASIRYSSDNTSLAGDGPADGSKCPNTYTATTHTTFFLTDSSHPSKLIFVSAGQYGDAPASTNMQADPESWLDTLVLF